MNYNSRLIVLECLLKVNKSGGYSNIVLDNQLKKYDLCKRDVTFITAIFYGVLEKMIYLNYLISNYSKIPIPKISDDIIEILRIGIYQILYMDKVPNSAAVNESVNMCRAKRKSSACGFVNAVLRAVIRNINNLPLPDEKNKTKYFSVKYSCPEEIINLWQLSYGDDVTIKLLESLSSKPPLTIRVNTLKTNKEKLMADFKKEGISVYDIGIVDNALNIESNISISENEAFKQGKFYVQDASSQICCKLLNPKPGDKILDVCSAPGGKSFTIAQIMQNLGKIDAFDIHDHKVNLIKQGAKRLGIDIIHASKRDAKTEKFDLKEYDKVLCDVPCSGLGIIRRKPEIRYFKKETLDSFKDLQYLILYRSKRFVKIGGILFYSTCTLNIHENKEVCDRFLNENPEFSPYNLNLDGLKSAIEEPKNQLTLMPHTNNTDGFFICAFKRQR